MHISNNFSVNINRDEFPVYFAKIRKYRVYTHIYTYIHYIFVFLFYLHLKCIFYIFNIYTKNTKNTRYLYTFQQCSIRGKTQKTQSVKNCFSPTPPTVCWGRPNPIHKIWRF